MLHKKKNWKIQFSIHVLISTQFEKSPVIDWNISIFSNSTRGSEQFTWPMDWDYRWNMDVISVKFPPISNGKYQKRTTESVRQFSRFCCKLQQMGPLLNRKIPTGPDEMAFWPRRFIVTTVTLVTLMELLGLDTSKKTKKKTVKKLLFFYDLRKRSKERNSVVAMVTFLSEFNWNWSRNLLY